MPKVKGVSIHAPAWDATDDDDMRFREAKVSIHAPAWDATIWYGLPSFIYKTFQSTRPHGTRQPGNMEEAVLWTLFQSTRPHGTRPVQELAARCIEWFQSTRPHGTRRAGQRKVRRFIPFQSTRPHGTRLNSPSDGQAYGMFQSTRPHGTRLGWFPALCALLCFNPRARMGRDFV